MPFHSDEYADLLGNNGSNRQDNSSLEQIIHDLDVLYKTPEPPAHLTQPYSQVHGSRLVSAQQRARMQRWTPPRRKTSMHLALLAAAIMVIVLLSAATILPLVQQATNGVISQQANLPTSAYQNIHQTKVIPGTRVTITLEKGYADANRILLIYTSTVPSNYSNASANVDAEKIIVDPDIVLGRDTLVANTTAGNVMARTLAYDANGNGSGIIGNPPVLHLHLQMSDPTIVPNQGNMPPHVPVLHGHIIFDFSLPFHTGKMIQPHQSVTVQGQTITLERITITHSMTYLSFKGIKHADLFYGEVTVGKLALKFRDMSIDFPGGSTTCPLLFDPSCTARFRVQHDYFDQMGPWTVSLKQYKYVGGQNVAQLAWTFKFDVP